MKRLLFVITTLLLCLQGYSQKFVRIEETDTFVEVLNVSHKHMMDEDGDIKVVVESTDRKLYIVPQRLVCDSSYVVSYGGQLSCVKGSTQLERYFRKYEYNNETITKLYNRQKEESNLYNRQKEESNPCIPCIRTFRPSGALYLASDIGIILSAGIMPLAMLVFEPAAVIVPAAIIGTTALILRINGDVKLMKDE